MLDQHRAGARTVLNLAAGALGTYLDPAYLREGRAMNRLRRTAQISAAIAVPIALLAVPAGLWVHGQDVKDGSWPFAPRGNLLAGISRDGTVTMFSLAHPGRPVRTATVRTVTAGQISASACTGGCSPMYALAFAPDGYALTAVVDLSPVSPAAFSPSAPQPSQVARNYAFRWTVLSPRSVRRSAALSHAVTISGGVSLPLLDPSGRTIVTGASSGFALTVWRLP